MYIIKDINGETIKENGTAKIFNHIADAEIWITSQAEQDATEAKYNGVEDITVEDCKADYEVKELKIKCGYDGGIELCENVTDVRNAVKYGIEQAEQDREGEPDAIEYVTFEIIGDCSEYNGSYNIYEASEEGIIINSNLPDDLSNAF